MEVKNLTEDLEKSQKLSNGLADAIGYTYSPFNFPNNQGVPGTAPVEQLNTIFRNLRYYFVSNFRQVLNQAYVEIGLVRTIVDVPVDDALRGGIMIKSKQLDEDQVEDLQISVDREDILRIVGEANKWNRLFGGAGIVILTDQDPTTPFDIEAIGPDTPLEFRAADLWELFWTLQNTDGYDPSQQLENFEFYQYYTEQLHKSRVMRIKGATAPSFVRPRLRGWGMSVVETLVRSLNQYLKATDLTFEVLDEFKLDIFKIRDLTNTVMSPQGSAAVRQRIQMTAWQKNYQNAMVLDKEDDYEQKQLSFAGLSETMEGIRMQVAADMRMPMIKLFGVPASGLNANDEGGLEVYNSMVESEVRNKIKYDILRILEIKCQKMFRFVPDDLSIEFKPLRVLSAEQEESVKNSKFNRALQAKTAGIISMYECRDICNKGDLFDVTLDNSGDELNPDDPQVADIVAEGYNNPENPQDLDNPAEGRDDVSKVKASEKGGIPKGETKSKEAKVTNTTNPNLTDCLDVVGQFTLMEKFVRSVANSLEFDRASYEADGGDSLIGEDRMKLLETLTPSDKALFEECKKESVDIYGICNLAFAIWLFRKKGGKLI